MIDIKAIKEEARKDMMKEQAEKTKSMIVKQFRVVELARAVLRAEELKLTDIEQQIDDGTL
jgi:hypothetical protein